MRIYIPTILLLVLFGNATQAQENVYVGLGYGGFDYEEKTADLILDNVGDTLESIKLFGGFELNEHIALEISYGESDDLQQSGFVVVDLGAIVDPSVGLEVFPDTTVSRNLNIDHVTTALRAVGQVPLGDWGVFLGGIGWFRTDSDVRQTDFYTNDLFDAHPLLENPEFDTFSATLRNDGLMATLGVEWRFGRFGTRYGVRLEYEWWDIDNVDASTIGVALTYGF